MNKHGIKELVDRRRMWAINLRMGKDALKKSQVRICSLHFTENDFFSSGINILLLTLCILLIINYFKYS